MPEKEYTRQCGMPHNRRHSENWRMGGRGEKNWDRRWHRVAREAGQCREGVGGITGTMAVWWVCPRRRARHGQMRREGVDWMDKAVTQSASVYQRASPGQLQCLLNDDGGRAPGMQAVAAGRTPQAHVSIGGRAASWCRKCPCACACMCAWHRRCCGGGCRSVPCAVVGCRMGSRSGRLRPCTVSTSSW